MLFHATYGVTTVTSRSPTRLLPVRYQNGLVGLLWTGPPASPGRLAWRP